MARGLSTDATMLALRKIRSLRELQGPPTHRPDLQA